MKKGSTAPKFQKISQNEIIFLVRAYNESSRIAGVIDSLKKAGFSKILVVNDGSKDATLEIVSQYTSVHIVSHPYNR